MHHVDLNEAVQQLAAGRPLVRGAARLSFRQIADRCRPGAASGYRYDVLTLGDWRKR
jgi:hypothetical protein